MCEHNVNFYHGELEQLKHSNFHCCVGMLRHLHVVFYIWCLIVNWDWVGHHDQGLTQKHVPCGAASSASTSYHSEDHVCEH